MFESESRVTKIITALTSLQILLYSGNGSVRTGVAISKHSNQFSVLERGGRGKKKKETALIPFSTNLLWTKMGFDSGDCSVGGWQRFSSRAQNTYSPSLFSHFDSPLPPFHSFYSSIVERKWWVRHWLLCVESFSR